MTSYEGMENNDDHSNFFLVLLLLLFLFEFDYSIILLRHKIMKKKL